MAPAVPPKGGPVKAPIAAGEPHRQRFARTDATPRTPELSVVIVNFCQWRNTARLARQLRRSLAVRSGFAEIVIVDNHSPFHPVVRRLKRLSGVTIRGFNRNHGFAKAVNRGSELGKGKWLLLLNPDVTVEDGFLDDAIAAIDRMEEGGPHAGVVGFRLKNTDGTNQASAGPFPTFLNTIAGLIRPRSRRKCRHQTVEAYRAVDWVTGGCLLVRRDCFAKLGGLDETFFLYYEDVDFCRRAANAGWSVWYDPGLEVTHHWPLHARRVPAPLRLMTRHALLTYARKHWPRWQAGGLASLLWTESALRQLWAAVRGDIGSAKCYGELRRIIGDVCQSRTADIRKRLRLTAAFLDPIAAEQDQQ